MSFMDKAKDHTEQIDPGIDKAGDLIDTATPGRFSDQLDTVEDKAHEAVGKLDDDGPTPPSDPGA